MYHVVKSPSLLLHEAPSVLSQPFFHVISHDCFSQSYQALLAAITTQEEPKYFTQDIQDPLWRDAMAQEISTLEKNETWRIIVHLEKEHLVVVGMQNKVSCEWYN